MASVEKFNDHCWRDVIPEADLRLYAGWRRETFVGARPALLAIDLYDLVYRGGARPPIENPLNSLAAFWASSSVDISTKAKPRDFPVNLSSIRLTELTTPAWEKYSWRSFSMVWYERLPTKSRDSFIADVWLNEPCGGNLHWQFSVCLDWLLFLTTCRY